MSPKPGFRAWSGLACAWKSGGITSPPTMRALEWGHFFGAPTLLPHALARRWIIAPYRWNLALTERYIRRYARPEPHPAGTFTFYVARHHEPSHYNRRIE
jgi:hypothetical protein